MSSTSSQMIRPVAKTGGTDPDHFDRGILGLPPATATPIVDLEHGASYSLHATPVARLLGDQTVKMLAYNGSIPGPTLRVHQESQVAIQFTNLTEVDATMHWHGLRLEHSFDGVAQGEHGGMQPPVPTGGSYSYRLRFPDPGLFWYHPHIREDYTQEHGLYGGILVIPTDPHYWAPVNREIILFADDILIEHGMIAPFSRSVASQSAMGRFGNVMLINGETDFNLQVRQGELVRIYLTNTANVRNFNLGFPGAKIKLVGGDNGRVEREQFIESVSIAPSERVIIDTLWEQPGQFPIEHHTTTKKTIKMGSTTVIAQPVTTTYSRNFYNLRHNPEMEVLRAEIAGEFVREPDKSIILIGERPGRQPPDEKMAGSMPDHMSHGHMPQSSDSHWMIVDQATGNANHAIDWVFECGSLVKIRIENPYDSDLPMSHPAHFHGQRFLVLSRNGHINENLVWKDSVLVDMGETVDILLEASNPGYWMAHCHIAEHVEEGMMFNFLVKG